MNLPRPVSCRSARQRRSGLSCGFRCRCLAKLTAPIDVIFDRLRTRTNNPFGKSEADRLQIADDIANVEPLLRQAATHEIDTNRPIIEVVDTLNDIARVGQAGSPRRLPRRWAGPR
jgi:hypothetical protein